MSDACSVYSSHKPFRSKCFVLFSFLVFLTGLLDSLFFFKFSNMSKLLVLLTFVLVSVTGMDTLVSE